MQENKLEMKDFVPNLLRRTEIPCMRLKLVDTTALDRRQLVDYYFARHKLNDELQLSYHDSAQEHESRRLTEN